MEEFVYLRAIPETGEKVVKEINERAKRQFLTSGVLAKWVRDKYFEWKEGGRWMKFKDSDGHTYMRRVSFGRYLKELVKDRVERTDDEILRAMLEIVFPALDAINWEIIADFEMEFHEKLAY